MQRMKQRPMMFVFAVGLAAGLLLARVDWLTPVWAQEAEEAPVEDGAAKVLSVEDGDDITILWRPPTPIKMRVRLINTSAPFRNKPGSKEATEALADMVYGKQVKLAWEKPGKVFTDRSGRLLAYVMVDGKNANVEMVRTGWSEFFTKYGEGRFAKLFREAEAQAKAAKRGLHADPK